MDRQATTHVSISGDGDRASLAPFIIGVAGGTASGKTSVCRKIMKQLRTDVPVNELCTWPLTNKGRPAAALEACLLAALLHAASSTLRRTMQVNILLSLGGRSAGGPGSDHQFVTGQLLQKLDTPRDS